MNDVSVSINKNTKNFKRMITSTIGEYKSIVNGEYGYSPKGVCLTGLPRYDFLEDHRERIISFLPTWRRNLVSQWLPNGDVTYNENFNKSEYFHFYSKLINDKRIIDCMKKLGYKGKFYLHPALIHQAIDFEGNSEIEIVQGIADYKEVYRKSALLITDYSSAVMDFAYLKKPIVYTQFDKTSFFEKQYAAGYYDYERDGFGPVCLDYESSVNAITEYIENDCCMEKKYQDKVDGFFAFTDRKNSERVFEAITADDKSGR